MRVQPVSGPHAVQQTTTNETASKAKAVAAFNAGKSSYDQAQETPVADPNNISPEELSAVKPTETAPTTTEETPEQPKPEEKPAPDPALSRQFAQLARQERALRAKVQQEMAAIKQQKADLQAQQDAIKAKETEYSQGYISKAQLKQDTLRILTESGVTYDELTQQLLNQGAVNPQVEAMINGLKHEIKELRAANEDNKKQQTQAQQEQRAAAVRQIQVDATDLIKSNPIAYEAINKIGARGIKETVKLIVDTYDKDGRVMSVEEAADEVENYLIEENFNMASSISKIKKRLAEAGQPKQTEVKTQSTPAQTGMKTLTNAAASTRKLSARERAIAAMEGRLK
jgi:hypothetical protein